MRQSPVSPKVRPMSLPCPLSTRCTAAFVACSPRMPLMRLGQPQSLPPGPGPGPSGGAIVLLRFGVAPPQQPAPAPGAARIACVQIRDVSPQAVRWIRIRAGTDPLYQIDTLASDGFRLTSAGELVEAIATMSGLPGMVIELPDAAESAGAVTVDLLVADDPATAARVKVDALMR